MKVLCNREKLREGLAIANGVIPAKSTKPVLENVCLVATDKGLELLGTDLEISLRYTISDVEVSEPGTAVIPARVTLDFIRDLSSETVTLEVGEDENITIEGGEDSCELVTIDPDEYPVISRFETDGAFSIQAGNLTRLVNQTAFAAAREGGRYAMHGILTEVTDGELRMVATDGRRLAHASTAVDAKKDSKEPAIIPAKGLQLFCRVTTDPLDEVSLQFSTNQVGMKTNNAEVFARLIDGEYPRYSAVIPEDTKNRIEVNAEMFGRKLRLVSNVTGDDARAVRLDIKKGEIEFFGRSAGRGEAHAQMEAAFTGTKTEIAFNPDYVLEGLKNCEADLVTLEFSERTSPGKFRLGENYVYVVMPITVEA
jgi:DNA polymerase-3 subunit beta